MAQECKQVIVKRFGTSEDVPVTVAPGATAREVLEVIGEQGAMALATGPRHGLIFLAPATLWNWIEDLQALYVVRSSCPW